MLADLLKYDLLDLCLAKNWPEDKQTMLLQDFADTFEEYLEEKLRPYFKEEDDVAFEKLQADQDLTPEKVMEFYNDRIPGLEQKIDTFLLHFKRMFMVRLYEELVGKLKQEVEKNTTVHNESPNEYNKFFLADQVNQLVVWESVFHASQKDDWNNVAELLHLPAQ